MKKILTAINNPKLNEELRKESNFQIIGKDIQYKEAILEVLEKNNEIDLIILSDKIPGEIKLENLIEKIKIENDKIKIIFILEKENNKIEKILIKNNIIDIYYNDKINLKELIKIINKQEINMEEEIIKLKKIIEEKSKNENKIKNKKNFYLKKIFKIIKDKIKKTIKIILKKEKNSYKKWNMSTKIITFSGNNKSGKSTLSLIISQYLSTKNKKVLLIDGDLEKQDLSFILKKNKKNKSMLSCFFKNKKHEDKKIKKKIKKIINNKNRKLINNKNIIYYYPLKKIINLFTRKINKNLYFFNGLNELLKNNKLKREKIINYLLFFLSKRIKKFYQFIIIDLSKSNGSSINQLIIKNSDINFIVIEANMLGIKEIQSILKVYKKEWKVNKNSLHIVSNKRNFCSINKSLILKCIPLKNKIYEIKENKIYHLIFFNYFKKKFLLKNKNIKKEINKIVKNIIIKLN